MVYRWWLSFFSFQLLWKIFKDPWKSFFHFCSFNDYILFILVQESIALFVFILQWIIEPTFLLNVIRIIFFFFGYWFFSLLITMILIFRIHLFSCWCFFLFWFGFFALFGCPNFFDLLPWPPQTDRDQNIYIWLSQIIYVRGYTINCCFCFFCCPSGIAIDL